MNNEIYTYTIDEQRKANGRPQFDAVGFDVDSTLVLIEGLDWLADFMGKGPEVRELTEKSMGGSGDFHTAMVQKMKLIAPSHEDLLKLGAVYCENIVEGAVDVIAVLHDMGIEVWIVTGNFEPAVNILAQKLGIDPERVICNRVFFDEKNLYAGFDVDSDLAHNGGKAKKMKIIDNGKGKRIAFVGDGMTDLEVKEHVALFIAFIGVKERKMVKENADRVISDMMSLLTIVAGND